MAFPVVPETVTGPSEIRWKDFAVYAGNEMGFLSLDHAIVEAIKPVLGNFNPVFHMGGVGRDGLWMGLAANMCGLGEITRKHMQTLLNHSRNGQIPHEIALNFGNQEYEVSRTSTDTRFMSIDSNLLWIICNRSLNHWGYEPFPDSAEDKVLGFSMSCDKDGDMLIENDFKKSLIGWPETWASQRDGKCVDINALWIAVLESLGSRLNGGYLQTAIDRYLEEFFEGPDFTDSIDSNSAHAVKSAMLLVPAMFLDDRRVKDQFSKLLGSDMITPWGVRSMSAEDKKYDGGYHTGMVWPLMTGWFSIAGNTAIRLNAEKGCAAGADY